MTINPTRYPIDANAYAVWRTHALNGVPNAIPDPASDVRSAHAARQHAYMLAWQGVPFPRVMGWLQQHQFDWAPRDRPSMLSFLRTRGAPIVFPLRSDAERERLTGTINVFWVDDDLPPEQNENRP